MIIVAPTEPEQLRNIADVVSLKPEDYGADVMFIANKRRVGVQRKTMADLLASLADGRLAKQVMQMEALDYKILAVEGEVKWTNEGKLWGNKFGAEFTRRQWMGLQWSCKDRGIWVERTDNLDGTIELVHVLKKWMEKTRHDSLLRRPGSGSGVIGQDVTPREYQAWILQSFPGVGVELSKRIVDECGMILGLKIDKEALIKVRGMGTVKVDRICKILE